VFRESRVGMWFEVDGAPSDHVSGFGELEFLSASSEMGSCPWAPGAKWRIKRRRAGLERGALKGENKSTPLRSKI
jgi:hypothetical protein